MKIYTAECSPEFPLAAAPCAVAQLQRLPRLLRDALHLLWPRTTSGVPENRQDHQGTKGSDDDCKAPSWNINEPIITSHICNWPCNLWTRERPYSVGSGVRSPLCPISVVISNGVTRREAQRMSLPLIYFLKFEQPVIYGFPKIGAACHLFFFNSHQLINILWNYLISLQTSCIFSF